MSVIESTTGIYHLKIIMKGWYLFTRLHDVISHQTGPYLTLTFYRSDVFFFNFNIVQGSNKLPLGYNSVSW